MKAPFIQLTDGSKIAISDETIENIVEHQKDSLIDVTVERLRVSETGCREAIYPVRISMLKNAEAGMPVGKEARLLTVLIFTI